MVARWHSSKKALKLTKGTVIAPPSFFGPGTLISCFCSREMQHSVMVCALPIKQPVSYICAHLFMPRLLGTGYPFPYLFDEDQAVAQRYQAMCTPEFFLFDKDLKLQYHGQFDSARPSNGKPVTGSQIASECMSGNVLSPCASSSIEWFS